MKLRGFYRLLILRVIPPFDPFFCVQLAFVLQIEFTTRWSLKSRFILQLVEGNYRERRIVVFFYDDFHVIIFYAS